MKTLLWGLALAALAALIAIGLQHSQGTVVALAPPWRLDFSLNFFLLVLALALWLAYRAGRLAQRLRDFPDRVRAYRERRSELGALRGLREALKALFEGRFARAERAAQRAQAVAPVAALAALVAARAAHRMQEYQRREQWLERAEADPELATARLVLSAEMWSEQRDSARALRAVEQLHESGARHIHALRIALIAHLQSNHWHEAIRIVRTLDKHRGLPAPASAAYKALAYRGLMRENAHDAAALTRLWNAVPDADRRAQDLALEAARCFNQLGRGDDAASVLQAALHEHWSEALLDAYARCTHGNVGAALAEVERGMQSGGRSAPALRCLGRICLQAQLWGKARAYLEESWRLQPHADTARALAQMAEAVGESAQAAQWFRESSLAPVPGAAPPASAPAPARAFRREPLL
jgi:HemY protein